MILQVPEEQARAIVGAMKAVALAHGPEGVSEADEGTLRAASEVVLGLGPVEPEEIEPTDPARFTECLGGDPEDARLGCRMLAVMSLVDGRIDPDKQALLVDYAHAVDVDEDYLRVLAETAEGEVAAAAACIMRKNVDSFPHLDDTAFSEDASAPFFPYGDGNDDPDLEARYAALGRLPEDSFGWAFYDHFKRNGFEFPGNPNALAEGFTTPHDSSHVLSSYSTTEPGEVCVSTFIGAMHPDHPMAAEVIPVLFTWHVGIKLNDVVDPHTGSYDPRKFWTAWERGSAMKVDIVAADWDFWVATETPLEELRQRYGVPPIDESLLA